MVRTIVACVFALLVTASSVTALLAQYEDYEEQKISEMSSSLDKEMRAEEAAAKEDMGEMEASMLGNEAPMSPLDVERK